MQTPQSRQETTGTEMPSQVQSPLPRLLSLSWPIIGLNVLNVLALAVDTAMCGRLPNADTVLTGLGFASQMVFLLLVAMMGVSVGSVAMVSRAHGARDEGRVAHLLAQSTAFTAVLGLLVGAIFFIFARPILAALGAQGQSLEEGLSYLRVLLLGTPATYLALLFAAVLRGVGNTRLAFMISFVGNCINVLLNYGLILGNWGFPALGLQGAAIGTLCSHIFVFLVLGLFLRRGVIAGCRMPLWPGRLDFPLVRKLIKVGTPAALDMVILNAGFLTIIGLLGRVDAIAVAAHGIGLRIQALAFVPGMSVSQATAALVGQSLGAKDLEGAKRVLKASALVCLVIMSILSAIIVFAVHPIIAIFDVPLDSELAHYAEMWIKLLGYCMPIVGPHIAMIGLLQGAGATASSLRVNIVGTLFFQIPMSFILGFVFDLGVYGIWLAFPLSFGVKVFHAFWYVRRGDWARAGAEV
jgi:putative MATE family efflux protein